MSFANTEQGWTMSIWITTHWPIPYPHPDPQFSRHVYVKERDRNLPRPGDIVLIREAEEVKGKRCPTVDREHQGRREPVKVPIGNGGIIGQMIVTGREPRLINPDDVVYDFGDLREQRILECRNFRDLRDGSDRSIPLTALQTALGTKSTRFLHLWQVEDDDRLDRLLAILPS